jgi:Domain of unknown function (DUF4276)
VPPTLLPLVEGQSEVVGLPILLRRLLVHLGHPQARVAKPFRVPRTRILRGGEIERAVRLGVRTRDQVTGVVVVLDADDDDPWKLETLVRAECAKVTSLPVTVAAATREIEAWFLGAKESLRGVRSIRADATSPPNPEAIRGAKERLTSNMEASRRYVEVDDLPAFAAQVDLPLALQRCPSLQRLAAGLEAMLAGG